MIFWSLCVSFRGAEERCVMHLDWRRPCKGNMHSREESGHYSKRYSGKMLCGMWKGRGSTHASVLYGMVWLLVNEVLRLGGNPKA